MVIAAAPDTIAVLFRGQVLQVPRAQLVAAAAIADVPKAVLAALPSREVRQEVGIITLGDAREFLLALQHALRARGGSATPRGHRRKAPRR